MSSSDNEYDYIEMLNKTQERIKNWENPEGVEVKVNIDPKFRDDFYKKMPEMTPRGILSLFESCGNMTNSSYNFGRIDEKKVKYQIAKFKKIEDNLQKKIKAKA